MTLSRNIIIAYAILIFGQNAAPRSAEPVTDLYHVYVHSQTDADLLAALPIDPLLRLSDGYLVLAFPVAADRLKSSGLRYEIVAPNVDRRSLALDSRPDLPDTGRYPAIFREGRTRICRIDPAERMDRTVAARFSHLHDRNIPIVYRPPLQLDNTVAVPLEDLGALVSRIQEDSIVSYSEYLQSLDGRPTMTAGTHAARIWLITKFHEFGYDSVVTDTFTAMSTHGNGEITGHNVIAYKIGTENPNHHIIVGAHYDAGMDLDVDEPSPGADDNGSGVVAVMEIARALSDVDTRQTFVFILFDAEEEGKLGSYAYAMRAFDNNDRIAFMFNMDMIGYYENDHEAGIFWGTDSTNAELWASLASSLPEIDLIAHPEPGNLASDDASFTDFGFTILGIIEYVFSTVYHTYHDSTAYLNFDYLTRMARSGLATVYVIDQQFVPDYELWMGFASPASDIFVPNTESPLDVVIREYGGARLVPGSATLHYTVNNGGPLSTVLTDLGNDMFRGYFPALPCLDRFTYYITAQDESLGTIYLPADSQLATAYAATGVQDIFYDDFGSDLGWTTSGDAISGLWQRAGIKLGYSVPHQDFDGNGMCYVTDSVRINDVDMGTTSLISPEIDGSAGVVFVEYARWYRNDWGAAPNSDVFNVLLSSNRGTSWQLVETVGPVEQASGGWFTRQVVVGDYVTPTAAIQIRFDASDLGDDSYVEAGVDAVRFYVLSTDLEILTASIPSWTAYHPYSQQLEAAACTEPVTWIDRFGQLAGSGLTLSEDGLLSGIPTKLGSILFRAQITDQIGGYDEQILSMIIYDTLHVLTATIPSATVAADYSAQLTVSGGTGTKTWLDQDSDLAETGIALSSSGLLSGIPGIEGDFPFTALATDQVGATTEKTFTLHIVGPYVCGDADGDSAVNIGDAVTIINYIFKGGAPPDPLEAGDANADHTVNVGDAVYLITFIFKGGPSAQCP